MKRFLSAFIFIFAAMNIMAEKNVIVYTALEKLPEVTEPADSGLHMNAFYDAFITSHTFSDGRGEITFADGVTTIGQFAFAFCQDMASIIIPNSVTSIGEGAFYNCTGLSSITLSSGITNIEAGTFYGCTSLPSITIPSGVTSIGIAAFQECKALTSITIPDDVTSIGGAAFSYCESLTSITIPENVLSIGVYAFYGCTGLTSLAVSPSNWVYDSRDNCNAIIKTLGDTLLVGCKNTIIPSSVTYIGEGAFYGCRGLTSITIPNSVTSIGNEAFRKCSALTSVTMPNNVTYGDRVFDDCSPDLVINTTSSISNKETYSKDGISFTYPSKYNVLCTKDDNGINNIVCARKGLEVSVLNITYYSKPAFAELSSDRKEEVCRAALKMAASNLESQSEYSNVNVEPIVKTELTGIDAWQCNFTATILSTTLISGKAYITIKNDVYIAVITQAENKSLEDELAEIVSSLKF